MIKINKNHITIVLLALVGTVIIGTILSSTDKVKTIEITNSVLNSYTPENYEIYDYYYEDLDSDSTNEVIILYQESRTFNKSDFQDGPRMLPLRVSVLDHLYGKWVASKTIPVVSDGYSTATTPPYQYAEIPHFLDKPYRIYEKETFNNKWLLVYSYNGSYDGIASTVSVFKYDEQEGLESLLWEEDLWASDGVVDKGDRLFFIACSPFWEESEIQAYKLDLRPDYPQIIELGFKRPTCSDFFEQLDEIKDEERTKAVETVLNNNGIFLE